MLEVSRYLHLNPVRANMVEKPGEYKWSSYTMFIGEKEEKLINADIVEDRFMLKSYFGMKKIRTFLFDL